VAFHSIKNENLVEDPEVFIEAGSLFQNASADREARTMQLFQAGLLDKETAMKELQYRTGNGFVIEQLEGMAHANDMLEAVKAGAAIEIFATDDTDSFLRVFVDFVKTMDFYALPQERQDYIRDIIISVSAPNDESGDEVAKNLKDRAKVFPRSDISNIDEAKKLIMLQNSQTAQLQQSGAAMERIAEQQEVNQFDEASDLTAARQADTSVNEAIAQRGQRG